VSRPLRIVLVIDDIGVGGTQTWLRHLATGLAGRGHALRIYVIRRIVHPANLAALEAVAEVRVLGEARFRLLYGFALLWRDLRAWRPDVVQTQLPTSDWIGRLVARAAGVPVVISSVRVRSLDKPWWQFLLDRATARLAGAVVFNAQANVPFSLAHEGIRPGQVIHIPNGVALPERPPPERVAAIRRAEGADAGTTVIGAVGRLVPQKGHGLLITALPAILAAHPGAMLWLVGDGPLRQALERQAQILGVTGKIRFLGARDDVPELLSAMDLVVQPSRYEGMPNAVMEAMAAGRPVVATAVDAIPELVEDGSSGWLCPPESSSALAATVLLALADPRAGTIGAAARERMREAFSLPRMTAAFEDLYRTRLTWSTGPS